MGLKVRTPVAGRVKKSILGFRPEDCSIAPLSTGTLNGKIYTTELIGDHTLVTVDLGTNQIAVKAPKDFDGRQSDSIGVILPQDNLFVFDEVAGHRVR